MATPNATPRDMPGQETELSTVWSRINSLAGDFEHIEARMKTVADRALGAVPEPASSTGSNVRGVPSGAAAKLNEEVDRLAGAHERIIGSLQRLERFV